MCSHAIIMGITNLVLFIAVVLFRRFVHKEGFKSFLINLDNKGVKQFLEGAVVGFVLFCLYVFFTVIFRKGQISIQEDYLISTLKLFIAYSLGFLAVSLFEECLFRGYVLQRLRKRYSLLIAVGLPAVIFGLIHIFDYSTISSRAWVGIINATVIAIILSLVVIKTESLMWVLGYHTLWNLTQRLLLVQKDCVYRLNINEGIWTGNIKLPEGGLFVTVILLIMTIYVMIRFNIGSKTFSTEENLKI